MVLSPNALLEIAGLRPFEYAALTQKWVTEAQSNNRTDAIKALTETLAALREQDPNESPIEIYSAEDFFAQLKDEPPHVVSGVVPANKLMLLSGKAKEGKTFVAMEFLHCVAAGSHLMEEFPITEAGPAVYFGLEDGEMEIGSRFAMRGAQAQKNLFICFDDFELNGLMNVERWSAAIERKGIKPRLVIIDTAREAFSSIKNWNDAAEVGPAMKHLRLWARKNCTVILVCHQNKDKLASGVDRVSGSGALVSSADGCMTLSGQTTMDNGDQRWELELTGRSVKKMTHIIEMDTNTLKIRVLTKEEASKDAAQRKFDAREVVKQDIGLLIYGAGEMTVLQISTEIKKSDETIRQILKQMKEDGLVNITKAQIAGNNNWQNMYSLTMLGRDVLVHGKTGF